jgi:hypothetical protein
VVAGSANRKASMGAYVRPHGAGLEAGLPYFQHEETFLYFNKKSGRWFIGTALGSVRTKMRSGKPLNQILPKSAKHWESWDRDKQKWSADRAVTVKNNCAKGSNVPARSYATKRSRAKVEGATVRLGGGGSAMKGQNLTKGRDFGSTSAAGGRVPAHCLRRAVAAKKAAAKGIKEGKLGNQTVVVLPRTVSFPVLLIDYTSAQY